MLAAQYLRLVNMFEDMCSDVRPIASNISELTNNDNMCIYETALDKSSTKVDRLYTTASVMPMFRKGGKSDVRYVF